MKREIMTGKIEFDALVATIQRRGWDIEHDAKSPLYGEYRVITPQGHFVAKGFGRTDSLSMAYQKALEATEKRW